MRQAPHEELAVIHLTLVMEDTIIVADYTAEDAWRGTIVDSLSGKSHKFQWTVDQFAAILVLGLGEVAENKAHGYNADYLYSVAEVALEGCPPECQPIP
jgi:hypothetical protein